MSKSENGPRIGATDLMMLFTVLIWAVNISLVKYALRDFPPHAFNGIRLVLASGIYAAILASGRDGFRLGKADFWKVAGVSLLGVTLYQLCFIHGITRTTASTTSMIAPMTPVFIALLSSFFKMERISRAGWMGIAVSFAGFYGVIAGQTGGRLSFSGETFKGDIFILLANLLWAGYTVFSQPLLQRMSPVKLAGLTTIYGTAVYLPFAASDLSREGWWRASWQSWSLLVFSGVMAIVVGFIIWYRSVQKVGNTKTGIYSNLNPVFATIVAILFLGEKITTLQVGGMLVIFFGVWLTRSGYRLFGRSSAPSAPAASAPEFDRE